MAEPSDLRGEKCGRGKWKGRKWGLNMVDLGMDVVPETFVQAPLRHMRSHHFLYVAHGKTNNNELVRALRDELEKSL